ncbi:hypothetical protein VMCG_09675 [Cytospora schulzeri]|uniref:Fe2OG dioxygenase domain-containing protein n=1 Tax=Cytospora schulzeri TaxID=448051 RepID=A0A423VK23_9PEZI|nr:hypothetical protein VMCG_09675 [Valsa malicola]
MSGLLPINPADFPDVPTKKALIAIDLQNDFLAEDGALPVSTPDGMIDNIVKLAAAVRDSGYGEVVWVRSQFDTSRAAGEQQIVVAETTQIPARPGASAAAIAARARTSQESPLESTPLEADPEAFLSIVSDQPDTERTKPECVRKGTKGVELLPAIAAAKGPTDYVMTKTYYSAFQSGQLLDLLRRHFATELYICGALCNVSVYATALEASSYGFDITIVEDCCGYRSEMRHINARRKLTELTASEYATAADIIPTLRPKSSSSPKAESSHPPGPQILDGPVQIPPSELIAAAMEQKRKGPSRGGQGISVRPKSLLSPATPPQNAHRTGEKGRGKKGKPGALPPSPSADDLSPEMEKLKLNATESTGPVNVSVAAHEKPQPGPPQSPVESTFQSVVNVDKTKDGDKRSPPRANAQGRELGSDIGQVQVKDMLAAIEASRHESQPTDKTRATRVQESEPTDTLVDKAVHDLAKLSTAGGAPTSSKMPDADFNPTEELLTAEAPDNITKGAWPVVHGKTASPVSPSAHPSTHKTEDSKGVSSKGSTEDASTMVKDAIIPTTSEPLCEGDTTITHPLLPTSILAGLFERLCTEVHFLKMMHQGGEVPRFVAVQGSVSPDGTQPVYRHPSDETLLCVPFTPAVQAIREEVEKQVGHEMNHVLIQCYRGGNDYISEHSDKTLDIVKGSYIANVSLGAERTMVFRTKRDASRREKTTPEKTSGAAEKNDDSIKDDEKETMATETKPTATDTTSPSKRQTIRVPMPHNSLLRMGLSTNAKWLHGIRPDKRPLPQRTPDELAFNGYRISLTFRHIGTFLSPPPKPAAAAADDADDDSPLIWGQGAVAKHRADARPVVNGQTEQAIAMLRAFGWENNSSAFSWAESYGPGFDVLHMNSAPRYFACGDTMVDGRVRVALAELGVNHARGSIGTPRKTATTTGGSSNSVGEFASVVPVKFEVDDAERTAVTGDVAVLLYLDARYPRKKGSEADIARMYTRFYAAVALGYKWKALFWAGANSAGRRTTAAAERCDLIRMLFRSDMGVFETWLSENRRVITAGTGKSGGGGKITGGGSSSSETGDMFLAGGSEPSIADFAFWPVLQDITEEWRRAEGGSGETWVERGKYTALERYYVDFSGRKSVVACFGERAGALLDPEGKKQDAEDNSKKEVEGEGGPE